MSNWEQYQISVGVVSVKASVTVKFKATGQLPEILRITAGCGCTTPKYNAETKILSVTYTAPKFPPQIKTKTQFIKKPIFVYYANGKKDTLYIVGTKTR